MKLFLKRLVAYWLDIILIALILIFLQLLMYKTTSGFPFDYLHEGIEIEIWVLLSMSLPVWTYFITFEMYKQQTIGKRLLRLIVMDKEGSKINFYQALCRSFIRLLPWELTHVISGSTTLVEY
ncbi:RDD family protein [Paenibacillus sp. 843]|uniref:RDD family protein n=1 Tax=Paenibacillus sp. 843 TaxID=3341795 RepID=UPI003728833A